MLCVFLLFRVADIFFLRFSRVLSSMCLLRSISQIWARLLGMCIFIFFVKRSNFLWLFILLFLFITIIIFNFFFYIIILFIIYQRADFCLLIFILSFRHVKGAGKAPHVIVIGPPPSKHLYSKFSFHNIFSVIFYWSYFFSCDAYPTGCFFFFAFFNYGFWQQLSRFFLFFLFIWYKLNSSLLIDLLC